MPCGAGTDKRKTKREGRQNCRPSLSFDIAMHSISCADFVSSSITRRILPNFSQPSWAALPLVPFVFFKLCISWKSYSNCPLQSSLYNSTQACVQRTLAANSGFIATAAPSSKLYPRIFPNEPNQRINFSLLGGVYCGLGF